VLSWPSVRPLLLLMRIRAGGGHDAFDSELQNDPVASSALFSEPTFWTDHNAQWVYYGAMDPSLGRVGGRGDPSAILVGGYDRTSGVLDVLVADIRRRVPDKIIEDVIRYQREYKCTLWAVEAVQFQEFLRAELIKRSTLAGVRLPAKAVKPSTDKDLRIESLQPYMSDGRIRLHQDQTTLTQQLKHWPKADHDDGPDALHMLHELAVSGAGVYAYKRVSGRRVRAGSRNYFS
ncbi:MAG: phage terminase large subunit, partial [Magnetococcales bacterium]|nr:phage terminase large subunit [Magnetococcales bacterium]